MHPGQETQKPGKERALRIRTEDASGEKAMPLERDEAAGTEGGGVEKGAIGRGEQVEGDAAAEASLAAGETSAGLRETIVVGVVEPAVGATSRR